ncbi:MAG: hypothetical protein IJY13_02495, partial [Clostridia bacterium]|nr:hypothetical protein [Clostridia bacterium]
MKKYVSLFLVTLLGVIVMFQLTACGCNHDRVTTINAVPATCTQTGLTSGSRCLDCGEIVRKPQSTPAVGHKLVTQNGESATCQKTGLTDGKYCSVCGYVSIQQTVIPKSNCVEDSNGCCVTCGDILNPFKFIV